MLINMLNCITMKINKLLREGASMEKISLSQLRKDYMYLYENIDEYFVDDDALVNKVSLQLIKGEISLKDYLLWNI